MTRVQALRSVEIGVTDMDAALRFYTDVWNLAHVAEIGSVHYLRGTAAFHHILALHPMKDVALVRMNFDAAGRKAVDQIHEQVKLHGLAIIDPPAPLKQPIGEYGFGFKDAEGCNITVVCGVADHADNADRPDRPRRLSHININTSDCDVSLAGFRDALGFRLTDTTRRLRFLSCNDDHHTMVLGFAGGPTLNHIAFEMPDLESVMRGAGRMSDDGRAIEWGPGRHGPGNNVFCYFIGPDDLPLEYTAEMLQIDDRYQAHEPDYWTWPSGRLEHWGVSAGPSERVFSVGLRYRFTEDGYRLDSWR